jgi:predicted transposase/invertase (TIGR01784 family)
MFNDIARDSLDEWIYFLKNSEIKDEFKAKGLAEAREKLRTINLSKKELWAYRRHLEDLHMTASLEEQFRFEQAQAMEKGREEKALETARNLLAMGIEIDKIAKATGLKKEEVEKLASIIH